MCRVLYNGALLRYSATRANSEFVNEGSVLETYSLVIDTALEIVGQVADV